MKWLDDILQNARAGWANGGDWVTHAEARKAITAKLQEALQDEPNYPQMGVQERNELRAEIRASLGLSEVQRG